MVPTKARIIKFQQTVLRYYQEYGRDLPWRKTTNAYHILLSEVMLQQTQVDRGMAYYLTWTKRWKRVQDLAKANRVDVLKAWMGLGYNNRAINLHKTAQKISEEYDGDVIAAVKDFKNLPGIGPYTSAAVRIFARNEDIVTVDTNIRRILIHEFALPESTSDKELWALAEQCLPKGKSRDWHNGLMDYGATLLTSRKTGIKPKTQQSKFEGSDRQIRAKILRYILSNDSVSKQVLFTKFSKTDQDRLQRILAKMIDQEMLTYSQSTYRLKQ
jgi:A/G-specific adenine glycosylase